MNYSIYTHSSGEPLDAVEMHVLARAYRAAWRALFAREPVGPHVLRALDVMFVYAVEPPDREEKT